MKFLSNFVSLVTLKLYFFTTDVSIFTNDEEKEWKKSILQLFCKDVT